MRLFPLAPLVALSIAGCGGADPPPTGGAAPAVVVSIHPIAQLVRELAGPDLEVRVLLPPGAHADTYEPTPRLAQAIARAELIVKVGGGLDDWVPTAGPARVLVLTEGVDLGGAGGNPHVWLDPVLVRDRLVPRLAAALGEADSMAAEGIRERAGSFSDTLTALDAGIRALLATAPDRRFIAAHPAWTHFAARYGLEQVGVLHPSPGEEIGTRELARLVAEARDRGVRAVIAEPQLARAGVAAVAGELSVQVEVGDPIGGEGLEGRERYADLMRWNARAFTRALGGSP